MNRLASSILAAAVAIAAVPALAQPMQADHRHHGHRGAWPMRGLQLTEAQRDQIFKIFHEQAPAMRESRKAARKAREELRSLVKAATFDRARARAFAEAEGKALTELAFMRAEAMSRVREVLTPEQRSKLDERRRRAPRE
jgi:periplasmic protein CpxP/Spy